jgi:hypothetical protein
MKFKSDIEVQAGLKDSSGSNGTSGQILSSNGSTVSWIAQGSSIASDVQNRVKAGVAINKGQAVYVTGADGTNIIVGKASNTSEATSSKTLGLLNATVAINGMADVVQIGRLSGLNTIGAIVGDPVWLGTNGNLIYGLTNKPYAPAHLVFLGVVTRVNSNNGEIFVNVQNGFELNEIHDVDLKTNVPVNGDILGYNGTLWVNKTIAGWLGYTPQNAATAITTSNIGSQSVNYANTAGSAGSVDFNNLTNKTGGTGTYQTSGDFRAPIFYDSNDTTYYADFASTSQAAVRQRGGTLHGPNPTWGAYLLVGGDGRQGYIDSTTTASVSTTNGNLHLDAASGFDTYINFYDGGIVNFGNGANNTVSTINNDGSHRPQIIYDYNNTGYYLDPTGNTAIRTVGSWRADSSPWDGEFAGKIQYHDDSWYFQGGNRFIFRTPGGTEPFTVSQSGSAVATGDMRAPIFYDSNNSAYFLDPASNTTSLSINGTVSTTAASGSVLLKHAVSESDAWIFQENAPNWGLYWKNDPSTSKTFGGYTTIGAELLGMSAVNASGNGVPTNNFTGATSAIAQWMISNFTGYMWSASTIFAVGDMRAPIFYDANNTGYYLDPSSTSYISSLTVDNTITGNISGTAGSLLSYPSNWASTPTPNNVVGLLGWKNYGNGHVIFDASASTTPSGTACNNTNAQISWSSTYPTLMGWNGANTYGVRVDSARVADSATSAGSVDFNNLTNKTGGTGSYQTTGQFIASSFADSDNTNYYANFASTTTSLNVAGNIDLTARSASWAEGIRIRVPNVSTWGGIRFTRDRANDDGNWAIGFTGIDSTDDLTFWKNNSDSGSMAMRLTKSSILTVNGDVRAPIFYDSDNTSYYVDPNGTSSLYSSSFGDGANGNQGIDIRYGNGSSLYGRVRFYQGSSNNNTIHSFSSLWQNGTLQTASSGAINLDGETGTTIGVWNNPDLWVDKNGIAQARNSLRAPIFYDSNNTGYYVDPAGTSNLVGLTVANTINGNISGNASYATNAGFASGADLANLALTANIAEQAKRIDNPNRTNFTVGGNASTFYPVAIYTGANATDKQYAEFMIERGGYDDPGYTGIGFSTFNARFTYKPTGWGYGASYFNLEQLTQTTQCLGNYIDQYESSQAIIWLRGGTTYWIYSIVGNITMVYANSAGGNYVMPYGTYTPITSPVAKAQYAKYQDSTMLVQGSLLSGTDMKAPVFYDSNNTGYYLDPANTSNINVLTTQGNVNFFSQLAVENQSTFARLAFNKLTFWDWQGSGDVVTIDGGFLEAANSLRAPIFYDSNNTNYYLDPANTSVLGNIDTGTTGAYNTFRTWTELTGSHGFYSSVNQAHIYPNNGSYGSWRIQGSRNGWNGLEFNAGNGNVSIMILNDSNASGFHNNVYGWQTYWTGGSLFSSRNSYGGNTSQVLQDDKWINSKYFDSGGRIYGTVFMDANDSSFYFDGSDTGDSIRVAGDIVAYYSDERLKDKKGNIENALDKVLSLNGFYYEPNEKAQAFGYKKKLEVGLSAQEVEAVLPEIIKDAPIGHGYKTLDYGKLTPLLIEAIKEQQQQINDLKELVNKLINK